MPISTAFEELNGILMNYKNGNSLQRAQLLDEAIAHISMLPAEIDDNEKASQAYYEMVIAKEVIKYAENLGKIENQEFFEIMADYADMPDELAKEENKELADYFEFKKGTKQAFMRLKKPLSEYTNDIWDKFHEFQLRYITSKGPAMA